MQHSVFVLVSLLLFYFVPACMSLSFPGVPQHANAPWPGFPSLQMSLLWPFLWLRCAPEWNFKATKHKSQLVSGSHFGWCLLLRLFFLSFLIN
jgi:hypothetical protein